MAENGNVIFKQDFENRRRYLERDNQLQEIRDKIPVGYKSEISTYVKYCELTGQQENQESLLDFLFTSVTEKKVKKNTWEKRLVAVRKYLSVTAQIKFDDEFREKVVLLRKMYEDESRAELILEKGKSPVQKTDLLEAILKMGKRERAICLVNLTTANRPNEMVRMKIKDFDLEGSFVRVYLKKQKVWHNKRLNHETVKAVREYIQSFNLKSEDYLVGHVNKSGVYVSRQVSEAGYRLMLKKWTELSPYNFRKTQVAAMHSAGADLATIAKQTGHRSLQTLDKHYLTVSDTTVDKYL